MGLSTAVGGSLLHCGHPWVAEPQLPHNGLQRNPCSNIWSISSAFFTLVSAGLFHSYILTSVFSVSSCFSAVASFPFLNALSRDAPPLMGLSVLGLVVTHSVGHGGCFWQVLTEVTLPAPHCKNLATQTQYIKTRNLIFLAL